jgi:Holliday junction resolvasome RuvABC DNA-binding subunit
MPLLTQSHRAAVRRELEALGYSEAEIKRTIADIRAALEPANDDDESPVSDAWTKQLRSTLPSRGGHL